MLGDLHGKNGWTPAQIPNVIWFRSDALDAGAVNDGDAVTTMNDLGTGNKPVTQGTAGRRPILKVNQVNGLPVVRFDGTDDYLFRSDGFPISSDYSIYVMCKINDFTNQNNLVAGTSIHSFYLAGGQTIKAFHTAAFATSKVDVGAGFTLLDMMYNQVHHVALLHIDREAVGTGVTTQSANTNDDLHVGAFGSGFVAEMDLAEVIVFPSTLTSAQRDELMAYVTRRYGIAAATPTISHFVAIGDSLTSGYGLGTPATEAWPVVCAGSLGATWMGTNLGLASQTIATIASSLAANTYPFIDTAIANLPIVVLWAGTNDLTSGGTAAAAYANLVTIVAGIKGTVPTTRVIALTMIKRGTDGSLETKRGQYNTLILANTAGADAVVDVGADAAFDDVTDLTYYQADEIHITAAGHAVVAGLVQTAISGL